MYRMDDPTTSGTAPVPGTANPEGFPTAGNAQTGVPATIPGPWWFHEITEELRNIVVAVAIIPTKNIVNQVLQAIRRMCGGNVTTISAAGTTTLTADNAGLVLVNAAAGNITVALPPAASAGGAPLPFQIVRTDASANTVSVAPQGADQLQPGAMTSFGLASETSLWINGDGVANWQLLPGTLAVPGKNMQVFTASGIFTVPPSVTKVRVTVVGGGAGGGGTAATGSTTVSVAPGGQAGARGFGIYSVTPGEQIPVTVGPGGQGGVGGGSQGGSGTAGSTSSFGTLLSAPGGAPGGGVPAGPPPFAEAPALANATSSGGQVNGGISAGGPGVGLGLENVVGGKGGDGPWGGGGPGGVTSQGAGVSGSAPGAGGGGGATEISAGVANNGGNGFSGIVIVEW